MFDRAEGVKNEGDKSQEALRYVVRPLGELELVSRLKRKKV